MDRNYISLIVNEFSGRQINISKNRMGQQNQGTLCTATQNDDKNQIRTSDGSKIPKPMEPPPIPAKCKFVYINPKVQEENESTLNDIYDGSSINTLRTSSFYKKISQNHQKGSDLKTMIIKRNEFIKIKKENYLKNYFHLKDIGQGAFGIVSKIKMKKTGILRAAKIIQISAIDSKENDREKFVNEIAIPTKLDHPNIIKLYEVYEWKSKFILITDICEGGDLFERINSSGSFAERQAIQIMKQVLSAVSYIHKNGFVHRDLKPENILYDDKTKQLKIIDFGSAVQHKAGEYFKKIVGSLYYLAPEVIKGKYNNKCDVWSCGVILYVLLSGCAPFYGQTEYEVLEQIVKGEVTFDEPIWFKRSSAAKQLILKMLNPDFEERVSAAEALNSDWFKVKNANFEENVQVKKDMIKNLKKFHFKNKFKALVYTYIATQLYSNKEKQKLLKLFKQIDRDGNGIIEKHELIAIFQEEKGNTFSESEIEKIIAMVDTNDSGLIDFSEFLVAASNEESLLKRQRLEHAFNYFDADGSGFLTIDEIKGFLDDSDQTMKELQFLFKDIDRNGDGQISKKEFLSLLSSRH